MQYKVTDISPIEAPETYSVRFSAPDIAKKSHPGQFIEVKCGDNFLRRPFGICEADEKSGEIRFCFEVRGAGTRFLTGLEKGSLIDVLAPLGSGFPEADGKRILLVGGGIGVFPLLSFKGRYGKARFDILAAFRTKERICLEDDFRAFCENVYVATDDGSKGYKGFAASWMRENDIEKYDAVYVCGPVVMMKTCAKAAAEKKVPCFVSMEERMGCGMGACLGCACPVKDANGEKTYLRVCADGPVFDSEKILWDEL